MKEKEWLVFKENLARRKARDTVIKIGCILLILGSVLSGIVVIAGSLRGDETMISVIILCIFSAGAIIYFITYHSKYGKEYRDKLKELKELKKSEKDDKKNAA